MTNSMYSFDSFKLRFPIEDVEVLNSHLLSRRIRIEYDEDTGEVISEDVLQSKSLKHNYGLYQIHFAITETFNRTEVIVLVNSKLLEHSYLNGITMSNIELVYNKLMQAEVIYLPFESFLYGCVSDIDIKKDITVESITDFETYTLELERFSRAKKKVGHGVNRPNSATNKGVEWNKRSTATVANPFLKVYHKGLESRHGHNNKFFSHYVDQDTLKNMVRIETTLKNSKHFKAYGINSCFLKDFLSLKQSQLREIVSDTIKRNLNERIRTHKPKNSDSMTPSQTVYFNLMSTLTEQLKLSRDEVISICLQNHKNKQQKSRSKKVVEEVYDLYIDGETYQIEAEKTKTFFKNLGWV